MIGLAALQVDPSIIFFIFNLATFVVLTIFNIVTLDGLTSAKSALLSAAKWKARSKFIFFNLVIFFFFCYIKI